MILALRTNPWNLVKPSTSILIRSLILAATMNRTVARLPSLTGFVCAGLVFLSPAVAAEYSWQLAGSYRDDDAANTLESNSSSLRATYYLSPVDDEVGPYELAPFLNRSSHVTIDAGRAELREELILSISVSDFPSDVTLPDDVLEMLEEALLAALADLPTEAGIDTSDYAVYGRYVWPGTGWYAGARAERGDMDPVPAAAFVATNFDLERSGLFAGKYFGSHTAVELGFGSTTQSQEARSTTTFPEPGRNAFGVPDTPSLVELTNSETETDDVSLSVRHVGDLGGFTWSAWASVRSGRTETRVSLPDTPAFFTSSGMAIPPVDLGRGIANNNALSFNEIIQSGRERNYSISGALFPTKALGVRLIFSRLDDDTFGSSDLVGVSANWFFVRNAAAEVEYLRTNFERGRGPGARDMDSVRVQLGPVNTNWPDYVTFQVWNLPKLNTNALRRICHYSAETSGFLTAKCSTPSCMSPNRDASGAGCRPGLETGTPSTPE